MRAGAIGVLALALIYGLINWVTDLIGPGWSLILGMVPGYFIGLGVAEQQRRDRETRERIGENRKRNSIFGA
jgi:hypothetical protein